MEEGLLLKERPCDAKVRWKEIVEEMKRLGFLAGPMVGVTLSFKLLQVALLMMIGHLGELALSSTAIAISLAGVTGFGFHLGLASGLETIGGQAFGARQYDKVGTQTYTAILCLIIVSIPLSILWLYMGDLLVFLGQDPLISIEAGKFLTWLIPTLFGYAFLQPLVRFFQMQSLIIPLLISFCTTLCFYFPVSWVLVFESGLGSRAGAIAMGISTWLNVGILSLFMMYSPACSKTRSRISFKIFDGMKEFFRFALPSAVMLCGELWAFELVILLSGLLPNPQLETSVISVGRSTMSTMYSIPYGLAAAVRISNELGAGNPHGARVSVISMTVISALDALVVGSSIFASRGIFGYVFSNEKEVVEYVANTAPLVCLCITADSFQGLTGVARGCGWQDLGAYANLVAYYVFGVPIAATLAFMLGFKGSGLLMGIFCSICLQIIMFGIITYRTDWEKQAFEARRNLEEKAHLPADE